MCQTCTEDGKFNVCAACRSRTGMGAFPLQRDRFSWGQLLRFALGIYKRNWLLLAVAAVIAVAVSGALHALSLPGVGLLTGVLFEGADQLRWLVPLQAFLVIPQLLVQSLLTLGILTLAARLARGEPAALPLLFSEWRRLGTFLLQGLLTNVLLMPMLALFVLPALALVFLMSNAPAVAVGAAALLFPFILFGAAYVGLGVLFSSIEVAAQPQLGAVDAVKNAWKIARSQRLKLLLGLLLMGGLCVLGVMACFVGLLFALGYASVLFASLYLQLRNGAQDLAG
jgi:hypothetical protein